MGSGIGNDEGTVTNMETQASAHTCAEICYGYEHFGLQYHTQCFCDNQFDKYGEDTDVPSGCNTPCDHPDWAAAAAPLLATMPECQGTWMPECAAQAAVVRVDEPEICGGAWRNSVRRTCCVHLGHTESAASAQP